MSNTENQTEQSIQSEKPLRKIALFEDNWCIRLSVAYSKTLLIKKDSRMAQTCSAHRGESDGRLNAVHFEQLLKSQQSQSD